MVSLKRSDGRTKDQLRTLKVIHDTFGYADGSVLFQIGNTKVLCSVSIQAGVPPFLKGKKTGWLTAEYAMLPTATKQRTQRPSSALKQQGRSVEISRLIGRVFRTVVDLDALGERTIIVDCDVLQADGGTRAAAISGACLALYKAQQRWLYNKRIEQPFLIDTIAAISVGVLQGQPLLDLDFSEDSLIDGDFNFVLSRSGNVVEIQGTAEKKALSWDDFEQMRLLAIKGAQDIFNYIAMQEEAHKKSKTKQQRPPLFSLQNRLNMNTE